MTTATVSVPVIVGPAVAPAVTSQSTGFVDFTILGAHFSINPMLVVLLLGLTLVGYFLWQGQRSQGENTFDVWDLFMDTLPDGSRRASGIKCAFQISFYISSWVIVDREVARTLDAALFGVYTGVWCASLIAKVVFDQKTMPEIKIRENQ
jgi:hypothetical protein